MKKGLPIQFPLLAVFYLFLDFVHFRNLKVVRLVYFHASLLNGYCSKAIMIYMGMPYIFWKLLICCIWSSNNLKFFRNNLVLKSMKNHCFWRLERSKINRKSHFSQNWLVKHHISVTSIERGDKELSNEVWHAYGQFFSEK